MRGKQVINYNTYGLTEDGEVFFITTSDNYHARALCAEVRAVFAKICSNNGHTEESDIVAINRWLMHKDERLNLAASKSRLMRTVKITEKLKNAVCA